MYIYLFTHSKVFIFNLTDQFEFSASNTVHSVSRERSHFCVHSTIIIPEEDQEKKAKCIPSSVVPVKKLSNRY